jgi:predicted RNA polymerase sigma factor
VVAGVEAETWVLVRQPSFGRFLRRDELTAEAIRLTRQLRRLLPDDGEVAGSLALMLLTEARRAARMRADGTLVPLEEQDRSRWNQELIQEGLVIVVDALSRTQVGPYQLQAAIVAVHAEAARGEATDWPQILALYELLERTSTNPMFTLNRSVAVAMVRGPQAGLDLLRTLDDDKRTAEHHRLHAVRAHLLEMAGDRAAARHSYQAAARRTTSLPEQRYLEARADRLIDKQQSQSRSRQIAGSSRLAPVLRSAIEARATCWRERAAQAVRADVRSTFR